MNQRVRGGLPPVLLRFLLWVVGLTTLSFAYTMLATHVFRLGDPYGEPLFYRDSRWFDFTVYHDRFLLFRRPGFWAAAGQYPFTYPAAAGVLYGLMYKVPHALRWYLLGVFGAVGAAGLWLARALARRGVGWWWSLGLVAITLAASNPLRALFESANTEGFVGVLLAAGVLAVLGGRTEWGAGLIGLAGALKIYPLVLLALLLSKRRYREFAFGLAVAGLATFASLWVLGPSVAEAQWQIDQGMMFMTRTFVCSLRPAALTNNHSLFALVKYGAVLVERGVFAGADAAARAGRERALVEGVLRVYMVAAAALGIWLYFARIRRLPTLNQVVALTVCAVLLPPLSADYTLVQMLLPWGLVCLYAAESEYAGVEAEGVGEGLVWMAVVFSFLTFVTLRYRMAWLLRTLALVMLLGTSLRWPWVWGRLDAVSAKGGPSANGECERETAAREISSS